MTCLTFSPQGNLLAVGHANGDLVFWEFRRMAWESVKTLKDAHVNPIVQVGSLAPGNLLHPCERDRVDRQSGQYAPHCNDSGDVQPLL